METGRSLRDEMGSTAHIALGDSAGGAIADAFQGETILVTRDLFTEGPCRFAEPLERSEWMHRRADWWAQLGPVPASSTNAGRNAIDVFERGVASIDAAIVWVADGSSEQLHACWLAAVLPAEIELRRAVPTHGHSAPVGVGQCSTASLRAAASPVISSAHRSELAAIWSAFVAATPEAFAERVRRDCADVGMEGLIRLLGRFPDRQRGLSVWETQLLSRIAAHEGEPTTSTIEQVLVANDGPDFVGDLTLFVRLLDLAAAGLLTQSGDPQRCQTASFAMTELGRRVLSGSSNRVEIAGLDRYIGGTHLWRPGGALWCRDGDALVAG